MLMGWSLCFIKKSSFFLVTRGGSFDAFGSGLQSLYWTNGPGARCFLGRWIRGVVGIGGFHPGSQYGGSSAADWDVPMVSFP